MSNDMVVVKCKNKKVKEIERESKVFEYLNSLNCKPDNILAVKIDNELHSLYHRITEDCNIEFLTYYSDEGKRIYSRSLKYIFAMAVKNLYPEAKIKIINKMGRHYFIRVESILLSENFVKEVKAEINRIIAEDYPILKQKVSYRRIKNIFRAMNSLEQLENFNIKLRENYSIYECNGYYNYLYGSMVPRTSSIKGYNIISYKDGLVLMLPDEDNIEVVSSVVKSNKVFDEFEKYSKLAERMGIFNVADLNAKVLDSQIGDIIRIVETEQEKRIVELVQEIELKKSNVQVILIAGPSSSGKTTFSQKLAIHLTIVGKSPHVITMDNYFKDAKDSPVDKNGKKDYESINHLDSDLFSKQMNDLINGKKVILPFYNFVKEGGKKEFKEENSLQIGENDVLIVEGIHALNPIVSEFISKDKIYKIYIAPLVTIGYDSYTKISSNDIRLLRRIVRDEQTRGSSILATFASWEKVRLGEEKNIFPYVDDADFIYNTNLIYEIGVLKPFAENLLLKVNETSEWYSEARSLYSMLQNFRSIQTSDIPSTSIIKEFIGTGCFNR
ncbi:MAG: hypothetical protein RR290_02020 [Clostridia bacterium]